LSLSLEPTDCHIVPDCRGGNHFFGSPTNRSIPWGNEGEREREWSVGQGNIDFPMEANLWSYIRQWTACPRYPLGEWPLAHSPMKSLTVLLCTVLIVATLVRRHRAESWSQSDEQSKVKFSNGKYGGTKKGGYKSPS